MDKAIVFRIAWMKNYNGVTPNDVPKGGGEYVDWNQSGSEVFNFSPCQERMYGFVEPGYKPTLRRINIDRLGAPRRCARVSGVQVIWVARNPSTLKTVVAGWYKNATIHRERQDPPASCKRTLPSGREASYFVEAAEEDCKLILENARTLEVPTGKGGIGQKNLWYMEGPRALAFKSQLSSQYGIGCANLQTTS